MMTTNNPHFTPEPESKSKRAWALWQTGKYTKKEITEMVGCCDSLIDVLIHNDKKKREKTVVKKMKFIRTLRPYNKKRRAEMKRADYLKTILS